MRLEKKSQKKTGGGKGGRNGGARGGAGRVGGSQNEYDQRMENLLTELLPDRATEVIGALTKGKAKNASVKAPEKRERERREREKKEKEKEKEKERSEWGGRREYGLSQPDYNGSVAAKSGRSSRAVDAASTETSSRDDPSLSAQLVQLKREIKGRDDRLQRLTEHSMQLGNLCEKQKAEIAELRKQLSSYEMELDAKEQRASDAARLRKKAQKKAKQMEAD